MKVLDTSSIKNFLKHNERIRAPQRFHDSKPDIIFVGDMESTVIPLDSEKKAVLTGSSLDGNIRALRELDQRLLKVLSTGSDLERVKGFKDFLKLMGFDLIFTDNGKSLYVNDSSYDPEKWLEVLQKNESNPTWKYLVEEHVGWKASTLVSITIDFYKKLGFTEIDHNYKKIYPTNLFMRNETYIELAVNTKNGSLFFLEKSQLEKASLEQFIKTSAEEITNHYSKATGKTLSYKISNLSGWCYVFFDTNEININKLTSTEVIPELFDFGLLDEVKACIVAGDSENDEHLELREIDINSRQVPVFSLHSGNNLINNPRFGNHPRLFLSNKEGDLETILREIIKTIDRVSP